MEKGDIHQKKWRIFWGQDGTKIDIEATFGRLGRAFLGDLAKNRFFYRFFDDFELILGWFLGSKTEPRCDRRARRQICKNIGFT